MKTIPPSIFQYLGVNTNGDLGPYTFYTSHRKRLVVFPKSWPKDPATYHQTLYRNRWRHAAVRWQELSAQTRSDWETMAKRAHCTVSGYNLFVFYILGKGTKVIETIQRVAHMNVIDNTGPPIPFQ